MNNFDPTKQVQNRLQSLEMTGNAIAKCDVRIIGGTWSVYPHAYQEEFVKNIYDAHTNYTELRKYLSLNKSTQYIDSSNTQEQENEE
jgi:elongator complex protein 3